MDDLRLDGGGARVFSEWDSQRCESQEDAQKVAEILETISEGRWRTRWYWYTDVNQPGITTIMPRDGLHVHLRLWGESTGQFTIVSISDVPVEKEDELLPPPGTELQ
jgi:hypothetical protein